MFRFPRGSLSFHWEAWNTIYMPKTTFPMVGRWHDWHCLGCLFPDRSVGWDEPHSTSEFMHSVLNVSGSVLWHNSDRS